MSPVHPVLHRHRCYVTHTEHSKVKEEKWNKRKAWAICSSFPTFPAAEDRSLTATLANHWHLWGHGHGTGTEVWRFSPWPYSDISTRTRLRHLRSTCLFASNRFPLLFNFWLQKHDAQWLFLKSGINVPLSTLSSPPVPVLKATPVWSGYSNFCVCNTHTRRRCSVVICDASGSGTLASYVKTHTGAGFMPAL